MRLHQFKAILKTAVSGAALLLMGVGSASAATATVNITAGSTTATLPDGTAVPMWGYSCGAVTGTGAGCSALNPNAGGGWSPIVITVPTGTDLQINLTNSLVSAGDPIPTSIMIAGQIGGGLGSAPVRTASPSHINQGTTWPIANTGPVFTPPAQGDRVQSFGTEVQPGATSGSASSPALTWSGLRPGTYLLESGTHPSIQATMGLIGMLVVTSAPNGATAGTAYPGVSYKGELPLLFSEIDPAQNRAVATAVNTPGFSESATHGVSSSRSISSFNLSNPGSGYTTAPNVTITGGGAATEATAHAVVANGQVTAIDLDTPGSGYTGPPTITIDPPAAGQTATASAVVESNCNTSTGTIAAACYPSVVNYSPLYYQINGVAFDITHGTSSLFAASPATLTPGDGVLVRMVNAGSRMHVPTIVGSVTSGKPGFALVAEDGNPVPGAARIQSEVFMAAGKTYDVMIDAPAASTVASPATALAVFDRQLSLSANATSRNAGMLAYISVNGNGLPTPAQTGSSPAAAVNDIYNAVVAGKVLAISDPSKGVMANDVNIMGVKVSNAPSQGTLLLNADGTFTYTANSSWTAPDTFTYCGNGTTSGAACATVTLNGSNVTDSAIALCQSDVNNKCIYHSSVAKTLTVKNPGLLDGATDGANLPLSVDTGSVTAASSGLSVTLNKDGSFTASATGAGMYTFKFTASTPLGKTSDPTVATLYFPSPSNLPVTVLDGTTKAQISGGYRWIIEEDRTFFSDPNCTGNPAPAGCPGSTTGMVPNFGTNFHTSFMPVIASGCTDLTSCGNDQTVGGVTITPRATSMPGDVALCTDPNIPAGAACLDPKKRYFISVLPGDAAQPFIAGYAGAPDCAGTSGGVCGHGMGGAPIPVGPHDGGQPITVITEPSPYPPATLSVFVFEDDYPLNGEHDAGGGIDVLSPNEPGLGGFQITLQDDAGGTGDATGTPTYDMFNMPLSNSLIGTIDPVSKLDACPLSTQDTQNAELPGTAATPDQCAADPTLKSCQKGTLGMIVTCPTFESDGKTLSPLAGQAIVKNLYQGRYGVVANPGADRIGRGEEWVQTNTLDGQKAHDSFMRIGEPAYFQEFGPAGYHVTIGFANPKLINARYKNSQGTGICDSAAADCSYEVKGHVTTARMSRTPDERLYGSGTHDSYSFTQCYISLGDPDGADFMFTKCDGDGNFAFENVPAGNWKITTFDQWNDQVVDGITTAVGLCDPQSSISTTPVKHCHNLDLGEVAVHQWQANIYTRTFVDTDYSGVSTDGKPGLALVDTNIRFRDGSFSNFNNTDLDGYAGFNEVFPLFNWYVIETDSTRYKNTGTHVVYDSGGPVDNPKLTGAPTGLVCSGTTNTKRCEKTDIAANLANTYEPNPLPADLSIPGSVYCTLSVTADCSGLSIGDGPTASRTDVDMSTGRIDPAWVNSYGWQGYSGQNNFLEFGKRPFADGENGGIHGHVVYASTRPFDDPTLLLQLSWEPLVPHVRLNLYKEDVAADGVTPTLTLVDHTETTSFDDWAQGFRQNPDGTFAKGLDGNYIPNMSCPGQGTDDKTGAAPDPYYWFALQGQPQYLDLYANEATPASIKKLAHNSQFKCYDGMHNWNQLQPAPYDGMYNFPSVVALDPTTGKPAGIGNTNGVAGSLPGTNCTICIKNPTTATPNAALANPKEDMNWDPYRSGTPMLPAGKYVVEVVVPDGYELVKEEDKNILIGDNFIAPVTQQFGGLGSIFILPDQASIASGSNPSNSQNPTNNLGRTTLPSHEADTGNVETYWPCVGAARVVPDFISLFPGSAEVAPFAGATRNLCDRKEVVVDNQTSALAKFYVFTETHKAAHFTGVITDDFTAEFDPFSPQFGEKFGPAYLPISFKDWAGNEITRVYSDAWGAYNGLSYSTWEVNPPNPTGYGPTMMVGCMNDAGPINGKNDPLFQDGYSQFCYELPFMPGQTGYFDTPVVPTAAFAGGYNNPDCSYPDATPAIARVDGDTVGPWIAALKGTVTSITLTNGGGGYATAPAVTFNNTGTGGSGATATTVISGTVLNVNVNIAGEYPASNPPTINFNGGNGTGAAATAVMSANSNVFSVSMTAGGSGYTNAGRPTVSFTGGGGSGATGTAVIGFGGRVTGVTINNRGTGYTSAPTVNFTGGTGSGAKGTANLGKTVASVSVTNHGTGYTSTPTVSFSNVNGGTRATGSAVFSAVVVAINLTNQGTNYASAPTVTIAPPTTGTTATATVSVETTGTITITALGDQPVDNYLYTGPGAAVAPYNQQKVTRTYNFGSAPSDFSTFAVLPAGQTYSCNSNSASTVCPYVTIGGKAMTGVQWSTTSIIGTVPSGVANCAVQQQVQFGGSTAQCGQLAITAANGKQSVDTVTVTIGGKTPTIVKPGTSLSASGFGEIQKAIDAAQPGDLLIVSPGSYSEMVLMWKPVRLQGVGAASSIIDATPHPAGKLNPWRQRVVCLFGLALDGTPITASHPYNPDTSTGAVACPGDMKFSVDRLPLEATVGWDATLNGNLAEQLIEPTLMGAYEGAGITVLGKGVWFPNGGSDAFAADTFPTGTTLLNGTNNSTLGCGPNGSARTNPFPGNFYCNPSSIDGMTIQNSSQGGGAIWAHAWAHDLQIANNRILNNQGTMSGGITIGQGEHPDAFLSQSISNTVPGSCVSDNGVPTNVALPYCNNVDVNVHHNYITQNSSLGDELFSSTPAGAGGVTFCNGADYYKFDYNFVCGNMSTGDGAGVAQVGYSYDGDIQHNAILYNQSTNPTIVTNGGGLLIMGAPDQDPPCNTPAGQPANDNDCLSAPGTILPSDGTGPGLVINANLILGNSADSGSGGGLRFQHINGTDVLNFPNAAPTRNGRPVSAGWPTINNHPAQPNFQTNIPWNAVSVTNNIVANNVAGIDGGGVSLLDALAVNFVNNTVIDNNSTATSGVLLQTLFAPLSSSANNPGDTACTTNNGNQSCPQIAGLVSVTNSSVLQANIGSTPVTCPANHGSTSTANADCRKFSVPVLYNNVFWQNRALVIGVAQPTSTSTGVTNQQSTVSLFNPDLGLGKPQTDAGSQTATGDCDLANSSYWDIGVRGDTKPGVHDSGFQLSPMYSILTNPPVSGTIPREAGTGSNDVAGDPILGATYCNGSRVPPEAAKSIPGTPFAGWQAPPGTNESNALPAPPLTLQPGATVDEGNNWINLRWGPLSLNLPNPVTHQALINPAPKTGSPAINEIPSTATLEYAAAPAVDYFGTARKTPSDPSVDAGAIEVVTPPSFTATVAPSPLAFGNVVNGSNSTQNLTVTNTGNQTLTGLNWTTPAAPFSRTGGSCTANQSLAPGANCTISIRFAPTSALSGSQTSSVTISFTNANTVTITGSPVTLSGTGVTVALTPSTWNPTTTNGCGLFTCPVQNFTLTNGGATNLTGITQATLSGAAEYSIVALTTTCGKNTIVGNFTRLTPGQSCNITVRFAPGAGDRGVKAATLSITDSAGTQTSALSGTSN